MEKLSDQLKSVNLREKLGEIITKIKSIPIFNSLDPKLKKVLLIAIIVIIVCFVATFVVSFVKTIRRRVKIIPTPTPVVIATPTPEIKNPSEYVGDPKLQKIEESVDKLNNDLTEVNLGESGLSVPVLDFNIRF